MMGGVATLFQYAPDGSRYRHFFTSKGSAT
jgi:hypothetical protein